MPNAPRGEPGCLLEGANHGEISLAVAPLDEFEDRPSRRGTWELVTGNTAYVFCDDDEELNDQACAVFVALNEDTMLSVFVFLPSNSVDQLGAAARTITASVVEALPTA